MARQRYRIDLSADAAVCDANYVRLHRLLPEFFDCDERSIVLPLSGDSGELIVAFRVMEHCPYTTTVAIGLQPNAQTWHELLVPRLVVRLYHDVRTAEVTAYQGQDRFQGYYEYPNKAGRQPDEKTQLNRFLGEYLALCLAQGCEVSPLSVVPDVGRSR